MFWDELHQLLQRDVCSDNPQQNTLVFLHDKIHKQTLTSLGQNWHFYLAKQSSTPKEVKFMYAGNI